MKIKTCPQCNEHLVHDWYYWIYETSATRLGGPSEIVHRM
ncbi:unnamed protein product, partial [marine sediment metagenome]